MVLIELFFVFRILFLQVSYLQSDNSMLENRQKELKGTIHNLLQSRENFVNAYQVRWNYDIERDYHAMLSVFFDPTMNLYRTYLTEI